MATDFTGALLSARDNENVPLLTRIAEGVDAIVHAVAGPDLYKERTPSATEFLDSLDETRAPPVDEPADPAKAPTGRPGTAPALSFAGVKEGLLTTWRAFLAEALAAFAAAAPAAGRGTTAQKEQEQTPVPPATTGPAAPGYFNSSAEDAEENRRKMAAKMAWEAKPARPPLTIVPGTEADRPAPSSAPSAPAVTAPATLAYDAAARDAQIAEQNRKNKEMADAADRLRGVPPPGAPPTSTGGAGAISEPSESFWSKIAAGFTKTAALVFTGVTGGGYRPRDRAPGPGSKNPLGGALPQAAAAVAPAVGLFAGITSMMGADSAAVQTFTGSLKLLSTTIGNLFIPAITQASAFIQEAYWWFKNLDPAVKAQIQYWAGWGTAVLAGAAAVNVAIGVFGPLASVLGVVAAAALPVGVAALALGAALQSGITPGQILAGTLKVLKDTWEYLKPAVEAFASAFTATVPVVLQVTEAMAGFIGSALEPLLPVLKAMMPALGAFAGVVAGITAPIFLFGKALGLLLPAVTMIAGAVAGPFVSAFKLGAAAVGALWPLIVAHPYIALAVAITAVGVAAMKMSEGFDQVAKRIENASTRVQELEALLGRLRAGEKVTYEHLQGANFTPEERSRFLATEGKPKERRKFFEDIHGEGNKEGLERWEQEALKAQQAVEAGLKKTQNLSVFSTHPAEQRRQAVIEEFKAQGHNEKRASQLTDQYLPGARESREYQEKLRAAHGGLFLPPKPGLGPLDDYSLGDDKLKNLTGSKMAEINRKRARLEISEKALEQKGDVPTTLAQRQAQGKKDGQAAPPPGPGEPGKAKEPFARAIPKELQPQFSGFEQARKNIQIATLEGDPNSRLTLQEIRNGNRESEQRSQKVSSIFDLLTNWFASSQDGKKKGT